MEVKNLARTDVYYHSDKSDDEDDDEPKEKESDSDWRDTVDRVDDYARTHNPLRCRDDDEDE